MIKNTDLKTLLVLTLLITPTLVNAQIQDLLPFRISENLSILPSPSLSYQPETSWSLGAALISTYNPKPGQAINISTTHFDIIYTLQEQFIAALDHSLYLFDGNLIASGSNSYYKYPEYYFGNGVSSSDTASEIINSKRLETDNRLFYRIHENWYGGLVHRLQYITDLQTVKNGLFETDWDFQDQSGSEHGIGIGILHDSRKNQLNPVPESTYLSLTSTLFSHFLSSKSQFTRFEIDYRHYFKLGTQQILAIQAYGIANTGTPSYRLTGMLGGSRQMRAYYYGRYRNRQYLSIKAELRIQVYKRFGIVVFSGLGNVANNLNELFTSNPKPSYGAGLRIMLDQKNRANLRIDYAMGKNSSGWYISYGEAF